MDKKLPAPALKLLTTKTGTEQEDKPKDHEGRQRSFPHERGIWASYVYIDYDEEEGLSRMQQEWNQELQAAGIKEFQPVAHLHLSLTKTFTIRHHNIVPFVGSLQEQLGVHRRFRLELDGVGVYVNEERTRTFIGVRIGEVSFPPLDKLVTELDECLLEYKLPRYYEDRSFHISLLWALGDQSETVASSLPKLTERFEEIYEEEYTDLTQTIRKLWFKCGNKLYHFQLA
ncbi:U6 snRNA phosphodiesterase 1 [Anopheles aquasalis]|uniref:U6 snRNA phosphodiesterase 1 n=1 Tax=Anopheles aquasalis TaxID=42839 RepID=UPI00215B7364|nr:U6 snRNA phosphodiesterase 1 [Anopheles aquasalis]